MQYIDPAILAVKESIRWYSQRLETDVQVVRWGSYGLPLLLFPTAGGDAEEVERFFLIKQLEPFLHAGRLKVYSVDSINGRTWLTSDSVEHRVWIQKQFDEVIRSEVVPLIYHDCRSAELPIITAGASIGAFNALAAICRHPRLFSHAICMSGTYNLQKWLDGGWLDEFHYQSPIHFIPGLKDGELLDQLRSRFILLATGQGRNEDPGESWQVAHVLGQQLIPNRVDLWGEEWEHDWGTWRAMLPHYVDELVTRIEEG